MVRMAGQSVMVAGVGGVMTLPAYRGRGYARATVEKAVAFAASQFAAPFALMLCPAGSRLAYNHLTWQVVDVAIVCEQSGGLVPLGGEMPVVLPFRTQSWPPGLIDLCGCPW